MRTSAWELPVSLLRQRAPTSSSVFFMYFKLDLSQACYILTSLPDNLFLGFNLLLVPSFPLFISNHPFSLQCFFFSSFSLFWFSLLFPFFRFHHLPFFSGPLRATSVLSFQFIFSVASPGFRFKSILSFPVTHTHLSCVSSLSMY